MAQENTSSSSELIEKITEDVRVYFQNPAFDASHDFVHVRRVVALAKSILAGEKALRPDQPFDESIVVLGAFLHDVADRKYKASGPELVTAETLMLKNGASPALAEKLQTLVTNVSYSNEVKNPEVVQKTIAEIPELAIVQDADRLDAIGAIGVGRCFGYGGARGRALDDTMDHFDEKLVKLEDMMKTETGKKMAKERTDRLKTFMGWWEDEWSILNE